MEFEEYVATRGPALLRLAFVLTGDAHLAQDLVQSGLARAYGQWGRVARAQHPDAYVRRIIVNEHLGWRRRRLFGEQPHAGGDVAADGAGCRWPGADRRPRGRRRRPRRGRESVEFVGAAGSDGAGADFDGRLCCCAHPEDHANPSVS